jgi:hypothetical protein
MTEFRCFINIASLISLVGLLPWLLSFPFQIFLFDATGNVIAIENFKLGAYENKSNN